MFKKSLLSLIAILTCCALTCVGFSAWVIVGGGNVESSTSGSISSDSVIQSNDYVWTSEDKIDMDEFVLTDDGFSGGGAIGRIKVTFNLNSNNCKSFAEENDRKELQIEITLAIVGNPSADTETIFSCFNVVSPNTYQGLTLNSSSSTGTNCVAKLTLITDKFTGDSFVLTFTYTPILAADGYLALYNAFYDSDGGKTGAQFTLSIAISNNINN